MEEQKDMVLEVENLNVKFVMEEETVEAAVSYTHLTLPTNREV